MKSLNGISIAFLNKNVEEGDSINWLNVLKVLSVNDCCFSSSVANGDVVGFTAEQGQFFMPFSQAMTPGIWKIIGAWLTAGTQRALRIKIGKAELEASSLVELMDLLNRALLIYDENQKTNIY